MPTTPSAEGTTPAQMSDLIGRRWYPAQPAAQNVAGGWVDFHEDWTYTACDGCNHSQGRWLINFDGDFLATPVHAPGFG